MIPSDEPDRYHALSTYPGFLSRIETAERYAIKMLPFIPRGLPVYQSHGVDHSLAIIRYINQIFRIPGLELNPTELLILYLAAWFHDIGYLHPLSIHNRSMHPALSVEMIKRDTLIQGLVQEEELFTLEMIVRYHDTRTDLTKIPETSPLLRTPLLAALFRLTDAIDIGTDRCPPEVFMHIEDGLDEHSRRHWQAHQGILGCVIAYPVIKVLVCDPENPFFRRRIIPHLEEDCRSSGIILKQYGIAPLMPVYRKSDPDGLRIIPPSILQKTDPGLPLRSRDNDHISPEE